MLVISEQLWWLRNSFFNQDLPSYPFSLLVVVLVGASQYRVLLTSAMRTMVRFFEDSDDVILRVFVFFFDFSGLKSSLSIKPDSPNMVLSLQQSLLPPMIYVGF